MNSHKKFAIDIGPITSGHAIRGVGFYTKNLIEALGSNVGQVDANKADLSQYSLIHITHFNPFVDTFPKTLNIPYVVTIHDLIPLIYPKHYPPGLRGKLKLMFQRSKAKKASAILTDSEASKKDIIRFLDIDPEKVHVVYLAPQGNLKTVSPEKAKEIKKKYDLPDDFVLYIGDVNYNKNIPNLVRACKLAGLPLVIVGKQAGEVELLGEDLTMINGPMDWLRYIVGRPHPELAHYKNIFSAFKKNNNVKRLGFLSVEELSAVGQMASVYCQPSLYEGFGLPVLEAFSMKIPVVASRTQALVEVGGDACLYVDPKDYKDMAEGIKKVFNDKKLQKELIEKGAKRLKNFSWNKTAKETFDVYKMVAGE
jgi:glycosyltransferase involved in cell wall biosynthesis